MLIHAFLRRFIVVRDNGQRVICAQFFCCLGKHNRFTGVVCACACDNRNAFVGGFDYGFNHFQMLINGKGGGFACCAHGNDGICAVSDVPFNQCL